MQQRDTVLALSALVLLLMMNGRVANGQTVNCSAKQYGPSCQYNCVTYCQDEKNCVTTSTGGCSSCNKGYTGAPLCQTACGTGANANKFGFNCQLDCHCANTAASQCDPVGGNCLNGCNAAWIGPGCQTRLPVLTTPPAIVQNDCTQLQLTIRRFNTSLDIGSNSIEYYALQQLNSSGSGWADVKLFYPVETDPFTYTILNNNTLNNSVELRFRVQIKYKQGLFEAIAPAGNVTTVLPVCITTTTSTTAPTTTVPPLGPFIVSVQGTNLSITWNASLTPTLSSYNITVEALTLGDCANLTDRVSVSVPVARQSYLYTGVHWAQYRVTAYSIDNRGNAGTPVSNVYGTSEARSLTAPSIRLLGFGMDWLAFTWSLPACQLRLGTVTGFTYIVHDVSNANRLEVVRDTTTNVITVNQTTGITPFTQYNITVSFTNSRGVSPEAVVALTTVAARGPDPPIDIVIRSITTTTANVTWVRPTVPKAPLQDYILTVLSPKAGTYTTELTWYLLQTLQPGTQYTVQLTSRSTNGSSGSPSSSVTFTTLATASQVESLSNTSRSSSSIQLQWSKPVSSTNLTGYWLSYTALATQSSSVSIAGEAGNYSETDSATVRAVSPLKPATQYQICVRPLYSDSSSRGVQRCLVAWTAPGSFAANSLTPPTVTRGVNFTSAAFGLSAHLGYTGGPLSYLLSVQRRTTTVKRRRRAISPALVGLTGATPVAVFSNATLPAVFVVGDGASYGGFSNAALNPGTQYTLYFTAFADVDGLVAYVSASAAFATNASAGTTTGPIATTTAAAGGTSIGLIIGLVLLFLILLIIAAIILYCYCSRMMRNRSKSDYAIHFNAGKYDPDAVKGIEPQSADYWSATNNLTDSRRLLVDPLQPSMHASVMSCNTGISCREEYAALPQGYSPTKTCHRARQPGNVARNRSPLNLPYDGNLVELGPAGTNAGYYNACYVNGYIRRSAYISAQSPTDKESAGYFWQIVAEQNVAQIVMLCQEFEGKSLHSLKYWPDAGEAAEFHDGRVRVSCLHEVRRNFYWKRLLKVNKLEVTQYQFICWPDTTVPKNPLPLLALYFSVKVASRIEDGPLMVHCATGLSRTGIFIALDFLLQQAMHESCVSVFKCVRQLRKSRPNSLPDQREYALLYDLLFDAMLVEGRNIVRLDVKEHLSQLMKRNNRIGQSFLWEQFTYLQQYTHQPVCHQLQPAADRDPAVLPSVEHRVRLPHDAYINAVWLDGFCLPDDIIVTQTPMADTLEHFWTMVLAYRSTHIVDLQPEQQLTEQLRFYPQPPETSRRYGSVTVRVESRRSAGYKLLIESASSEQLHATVQVCSDLFAQSQPQPKSMYKAVEELLLSDESRTGPYTFVCTNGADRCGLFSACLLAAQHLQAEQYCDVYHTVKWMRMRRQRLVYNIEQYQFVLEFLAYYARRKLKSRSGGDLADTADNNIYSHSRAPVLQQRSAERIAYHYRSQEDLGSTLHSTFSADLV